MALTYKTIYDTEHIYSHPQGSFAKRLAAELSPPV